MPTQMDSADSMIFSTTWGSMLTLRGEEEEVEEEVEEGDGATAVEVEGIIVASFRI